MTTQTPDTRPGPYYVSAVDAGRLHLMAGPYADHAAALTDVDRALSIAHERGLRQDSAAHDAALAALFDADELPTAEPSPAPAMSVSPTVMAGSASASPPRRMRP